MANRHIQAVDTPYSHIINTANNEWYNADTEAFEAFDAGNLADYAVLAGSQFGTTGKWTWEFPSGIAAGQYSVFIHDGDDDSLVDAGVVDWDGASLQVAADVRKVTGTAVTNVDDFKATGFLTTLGDNAPEGWINNAAFANSAIGASKIASGALSASKFAADYFTAIRTALGLAAANLDTVLGGIVSNVSTLLSRLTSTRAGYLDNLSGGQVATQSDVMGITVSSRIKISIPPVMERPDSSSVAYRIWIYHYGPTGLANDLDSLPVVTVQNNAGTDRSTNLGTVTKEAATTGIYRVDYTIADTHAIEGLVIKVDAEEESVTTRYVASSIVVDTTAVDFTAADRIKLDAIHDDRTLPAADYATPANLPANFGNLAINASGHIERVTLVDTTTTNGDKTGYSLTSGQVDAIRDGLAEQQTLSDGITALLEAIGDLDFDTDVPPETIEAIATEIFDQADMAEGFSMRELFRLISAVLLGKSTGSGTTFRNLADTKDRVVGTVDEDSNRTAVTLDVTP